MDRFKTQIWQWNITTFGNIFWRKKRCKARLFGVQVALTTSPRKSLFKLEQSLLDEWNDILNQEDSYWKQRARIQWLSTGERHTKFFHASAKQKQRRLQIAQLKTPDGDWCSDDLQLQEMARQCYLKLYTHEPTIPLQPHQWTFPKLNRNSLRWLNRVVTGDEIKRAVFDLGAHKAPDPDGLPACFFQKYWYWVGESVTKFILEVFRTRTVPADMNHAVLCLLPKQHPPEDISQFRPICLSNVLIKVISKVLANRVKRVIGDLAGKWQSSFIPNRQATDNIVIAQEVVHSMRRGTGRKRGMVVKIDLEKAYDRIDWTFLESVLRTVGFEEGIVSIILGCLRNTQLSVLWNGNRLAPFSPQRGLRQGDPLSPYLFVLCMETLGQRIQTAAVAKRWKGYPIGTNRSPVSHLFFADDVLLFGEASIQQAQVMQDILQDFCGESGQRVNQAKSRIWYAPKTPLSTITAITQFFGMLPTQDLGKYLGVPIIHGRLRHQHFAYLVDRVHSRLGGWKHKLLSQAARLLLIQAVTSALPAYVMNSCQLPGRTTAALERANRRFVGR